jgi:uncharacterized protein
MTHWASALYPGIVAHRRTSPVVHKLRYRIFQMLFDLDEIPALDRSLRLVSQNRFNLIGFHDRDHLAGAAAPLRQQVEGHLADAGIDIGGGAIRVLCMPRLLGMVFNPISVYFCHHPDGTLAAMLYEVNNTFGQRHCYLLPVEATNGAIVQECPKLFFVSPFFGLDMTYRFQVTPPGDTVSVAIRGTTGAETMITTSFTGTRQLLSDRTLARAFLLHPLLALKVLAGIHWEALRLWRKGVRLQPRPPMPADAVSVHATSPKGS